MLRAYNGVANERTLFKAAKKQRCFVDVRTVSRAGLKRVRHDWAHQAMDHWSERVTRPTLA